MRLLGGGLRSQACFPSFTCVIEADRGAAVCIVSLQLAVVFLRGGSRFCMVFPCLHWCCLDALSYSPPPKSCNRSIGVTVHVDVRVNGCLCLLVRPVMKWRKEGKLHLTDGWFPLSVPHRFIYLWRAVRQHKCFHCFIVEYRLVTGWHRCKIRDRSDVRETTN